MRNKFINAGAIRTRYVEAGQGGTPLVLLHGLGGTLEDWAGAVSELAKGRKVIALDLLGCGDTDKPAGCTYTPEHMRDHVAAFLEAMNIAQFDLNGWSMGGRIAIDLAHLLQGSVHHLILTAPAGVGPDSIVNLRQPLLPLIGQVLSQPVIAGTRILRNALHQEKSAQLMSFAGRRLRMVPDRESREVFRTQMQTFMGPTGFLPEPRAHLLAKLPEIKAPTCAIWGRDDMFVPARHGAILVKRMPNCRLILLDHAGHMPQVERPLAYVEKVAGFLDGAL